jgi:hypothetical protein
LARHPLAIFVDAETHRNFVPMGGHIGIGLHPICANGLQSKVLETNADTYARGMVVNWKAEGAEINKPEVAQLQFESDRI